MLIKHECWNYNFFVYIVEDSHEWESCHCVFMYPTVGKHVRTRVGYKVYERSENIEHLQE